MPTPTKSSTRASKSWSTSEGNVHFDMKDTRIETANAEFNTETQAGQMTGHVHIIQPGTTIDSDKLLIFYNKRKAVLTGGVKLVTTRSQVAGGPAATPAAEATPTLPTTLICSGRWNIAGSRSSSDATGNVRIEQGDKRATSDTAHYDELTQRVTMRGHVQFAQGNGNWMRAPVAYLDMKDQTFEADGSGVGVIMQLTSHPGSPATFWLSAAAPAGALGSWCPNWRRNCIRSHRRTCHRS